MRLNRTTWTLVVGLGFSLAAWSIHWSLYQMPLTFTEARWNRTDWHDPRHRRHRIADRYVETGELAGRTREDVENILGPPPETAYFSDWDMVYQLGSERGLISIDSEWLVFKIDEANTVIDYRIVRD